MIQIYNRRQPPMANPTNYQEPNFKRQTRSDYAGLNHFFFATPESSPADNRPFLLINDQSDPMP